MQELELSQSKTDITYNDISVYTFNCIIKNMKDFSTRGTSNKEETLNYYNSINKIREEYISFDTDSITMENIQVGFLKPTDLQKSIKSNLHRSYFGFDDDWTFYIFSRYVALYYNFNVTLYPYIQPKYKEHNLNDALLYLQGYNPKIFYYEKKEKLYDVTFVGQAYKHRAEAIRYLKNRGIDVRVFGAGWEKYSDLKDISGGFVSNDELRDIILQSKINLNFTTNWANTNYQPKDRFLMIAACKAFQITENSNIFNIWFNEKSIATYDDYEDLYNKIVFFLDNDIKREEYIQSSFEMVQKYTKKKSDIKIINEIGDRIGQKPKYDEILNSFNDIKVFILIRDNIKDKEIISSLKRQSHKNIIFVSDEPINGLESISFEDFYLLDKRDSYITFADNNHIFEPDKIFFQVYSLENDKRDNIFLNLSSYHIYINNIHFNWVNILTLSTHYDQRKWIDLIELPSFMVSFNILDNRDIYAQLDTIKSLEYRLIRLGEFELITNNGTKITNKISKYLDTRVALYGGGDFTKKLIEFSDLGNKKIEFIFDSSKDKDGQYLYDIPIVHKDKIDMLLDKFDTIIISSFTFNLEIYDSIKYLEEKGKNIVKLF
jgi:hypothetical protein